MEVEVFGLYDQGVADSDLYAFLNAFQVSFPILLGSSTVYNIYRQDGATSPYPLDYIIDQAGNVAYANTEYDPEAMTAVIDNLLLHPSPAERIPGAPADFALSATPNPFNPRTSIGFELPRDRSVHLDIHDARGRLVRSLLRGENFGAGPVSVVWDGADDEGRVLPSGLYLAHLRSGRTGATIKLTLVR